MYDNIMNSAALYQTQNAEEVRQPIDTRMKSFSKTILNALIYHWNFIETCLGRSTINIIWTKDYLNLFSKSSDCVYEKDSTK